MTHHKAHKSEFILSVGSSSTGPIDFFLQFTHQLLKNFSHRVNWNKSQSGNYSCKQLDVLVAAQLSCLVVHIVEGWAYPHCCNGAWWSLKNCRNRMMTPQRAVETRLQSIGWEEVRATGCRNRWESCHRVTNIATILTALIKYLVLWQLALSTCAFLLYNNYLLSKTLYMMFCI